MRISDWSSDVCSSDLRLLRRRTDRFADGRVVGLPQISDQIGTFPRIGDARITHRGAGNGLRRMGDEVIERGATPDRSEEHTSELQSLMRISYAVFCLKKNKKQKNTL